MIIQQPLKKPKLKHINHRHNMKKDQSSLSTACR